MVVGRASLRLKTAAAAGTKIVALHFTTATNFSYSLLQCSIPPPLLRQGVGRVSTSVCPAPTLAFPSCRCRSASLPPAIARTPYTSHVPPTHRGCSRLHYKPSALTPTPRPDERSAILASVPSGGQPLQLLRAACGSRHGGVGDCRTFPVPSKNLQTHFVPKLHKTPLCCLLRVHYVPLPFTSPRRQSRSTAHRHIEPLTLIENLHRGQKRCCRDCQYSTNGNLTLTAAI